MNTKSSITKISVFAICAMTSCALGATFTLTTGTGSDVFGIGDSTGNGFQGMEGVAALGVFSSNDFLTFTSDDFITNFTAFGSPASVNFNQPGIFGNNGVFSISTAGTAGNAPFAGMPMVAFIGNAATFAAATEFLVLDLARLFAEADDQIPTPIELRINGATSVLFGGTVANIATQTTDVSINQGFTTAVPVPEPSALLLSAFGALALLRRKR